ncbi:DUF1684 domain-containing protein [Deinococcus peraridilitoris]|uniref:DUF1684 domain-containing protein n=1 Tax=Deinococcus peraridilitoris TaxID=432329 RepID=UPI001FDEF8A0|nr:DUF1684 domain-containing protein [Deinococcus peraridilitoris]
MNHLYARVHSLLPTDPVAAHALWRAGRDELFAQHPQSPLARQARLGFQGLHVWRYDPAFAFTAVIQPVEEQRLEVLTSTGAPMPLVRFGQVTLPIGRLEVFWIDVYGGGVFIPFRDATSGRVTYGGGRYLLDTAKSADLGSTAGGELILDFNFAYHPSCFYNDAWSCPLAPPGNVLSVEVCAGERASPVDS